MKKSSWILRLFPLIVLVVVGLCSFSTDLEGFPSLSEPGQLSWEGYNLDDREGLSEKNLTPFHASLWNPCDTLYIDVDTSTNTSFTFLDVLCNSDWAVNIGIDSFDSLYTYEVNVVEPYGSLNVTFNLSGPDTILLIPENSISEVTVKKLDNASNVLSTWGPFEFINPEQSPRFNIGVLDGTICEEDTSELSLNISSFELAFLEELAIEWDDGSFTFVGDTFPLRNYPFRTTLGPRDIYMRGKPSDFPPVYSHVYRPKEDPLYFCLSNSLRRIYTIRGTTYNGLPGSGVESTTTQVVELIPEPSLSLSPQDNCEQDSICLRLNFCPAINLSRFFSDPDTKVWLTPNSQLPDSSYEVLSQFAFGQERFCFSLKDINPDSAGVRLAPGIYEAEVKIETDCGEIVNSIFYEVRPELKADINFSQVNGCAPFQVGIGNFSIGKLESTVYHFGNGDSLNVEIDQGVDLVVNYTYQNPGTYSFVAIVKDSFGCEEIFTQQIVVDSSTPPDAAFTFKDSICFGDPTVFFPQEEDSSLKYEWIFGNGYSTDSLIRPIFPYPGGDSSARDTIFDIQLRVSKKLSEGCFATTSDKLHLFKKPSPRILPSDTSGCPPLLVNYLNKDSTLNYQYEWSFEGSVFSNSPNTSFLFDGEGNSKVWMEVSNNGCKAEQLFDVFTLEAPTATLSVDRPVQCGGNEVTFNLDIRTLNGIDYFMKFEKDMEFEEGIRTSYTYVEQGNYDIILKSRNEAGCEAYDTVSVEFLPEPQVAFECVKLSSCPSQSFQFVNNTLFADTYEWNFGDDSTSNSVNPIHTYQEPGIYNVHLIAFSDAGCVGELIQRLVIEVPPRADFSIQNPNSEINDPGTLVLDFLNESEVSGNFLSFWEFGDGNTSSEESSTHTYNFSPSSMDSFLVKLVIVDESSGCRDTATMYVDPEEYCSTIYIPTGYAPIKGIPYQPQGCGLRNYDFVIFDPVPNGLGVIWTAKKLMEGHPIESWTGELPNQTIVVPGMSFRYRLEAIFDDGKRYTDEGWINIVY